VTHSLSNYKAAKTSANGKEEVATSTQVSKILMKFNIFHTFAQNKTSWARLFFPSRDEISSNHL
jgi:hypothetical protein